MVKELTDDFLALDGGSRWSIRRDEPLRRLLKLEESSGLVPEEAFINAQLCGEDLSSLKVKTEQKLKDHISNGVDTFVSLPVDYRNIVSGLANAFEDDSRNALHGHKFDLFDASGKVVLNVDSLHGDEGTSDKPDDAHVLRVASEFDEYIRRFYDLQPMAMPEKFKSMIREVSREEIDPQSTQMFDRNMIRSGKLMQDKLKRAVAITPLVGPSGSFRDLYIGEAKLFPAGRDVEMTRFNVWSWTSRLFALHHRTLLVRDFVAKHRVLHFEAVKNFRPLFVVRRVPAVGLSIAERLGVVVKVLRLK